MATQLASESISKPELVTTTSYTKEIPTEVGRTHIHLKPHASYEGAHRWDPEATWTPEEEAKVVRRPTLTAIVSPETLKTSDTCVLRRHRCRFTSVA
jgi:hypothetical protein